jgi:hypothetical protein
MLVNLWGAHVCELAMVIFYFSKSWILVEFKEFLFYLESEALFVLYTVDIFNVSFILKYFFIKKK